jgi:type VI secretion system protein ImpC
VRLRLLIFCTLLNKREIKTMPKPISFGELDFNLVASLEKTSSDLAGGTPFRMLVIGDFSGEISRGQDKSVKPPTGLKPIQVDRDTLDTVLDRLKVAIELPLFGENVPPVRITFSELDDFHPDALYRQLDLFRALQDTRQSFDDPEILAAFVNEVQTPSPREDKIESSVVTSQQTSGNLLDQIIEQSQPNQRQGQTPESVTPQTEWDSFLHTLVTPHLVEKADPKQQEMIDAVDAAAGELMRMILHHEDFQAMEAAWRGLSFLVSRLETDSELGIFLLDISKAEFLADLAGTEALGQTTLYKLLVEQAVGTAGGLPWSVVAANYTFEKKIDDLENLGRMAKIAKAAGCPFVSAAGDRFLCAESLANTPDPDDWHPQEDQEAEKSWQVLRHIPEAAYLGLCLPRFLLRLPYGADTDPVDVFDFEEMPMSPKHIHYLWGNPCFAILLMIGQAFSIQGWQMRLSSAQEINSLPLHIYKEEGESHLKPCAEIMLSQRAAEHIIERGFMPLLSFFNQDMVRFARFQSMADPPTSLVGRWS